MSEMSKYYFRTSRDEYNIVTEIVEVEAESEKDAHERLDEHEFKLYKVEYIRCMGEYQRDHELLRGPIEFHLVDMGDMFE